MKRKIFIYAGYFLLFLFLTFLFAYLRFPLDRVKGRLIRFVEGRYPVTVRIGTLSRRFPSGVRAFDVEIAQSGEEPLSIAFDEVRASLALSSLFTRQPVLTFEAIYGTGRIEGRLHHHPESEEIELHLTDFPLSALTFLEQRYGIELSGEARGTATLSLFPRDPEAHRGEITLDIAGLATAGNPPVIGGMLEEGEQVDAGDVKVRAHLEGQVLTIEECTSDGDLRLDATGTITFRKPVSRSRLDLTARVSLGGALSRLDSLVASLTRKRKNAEGFYSWRITGYLGQPRPR
ncbi:MAG: type II secretion system protein GspN [Deltaproteobacteria bacterium]|nr:MAG: type II secretion system protein GspN [Deltaproteobacteria bacterium]